MGDLAIYLCMPYASVFSFWEQFGSCASVNSFQVRWEIAHNIPKALASGILPPVLVASPRAGVSWGLFWLGVWCCLVGPAGFCL